MSEQNERPNFFTGQVARLAQLRQIAAEQNWNADEQTFEFLMCSGFVESILGTEWHAKKIAFNDDPDPWMLNGNDRWLRANPVANDVRRYWCQFRTVRLADAFWTLFTKGAEGTDQLRERFHTRPTKACFLEAEVASHLAILGYRVTIREESGKRGDDFDLGAVRDGVEVSVEVTSKLGPDLTAETLQNTLFAKRDQVPANRPAVMYLHVPGEWLHLRRQKDIFTNAFVTFYKRSRRFNAIVLIGEEMEPGLSGGAQPGMTMVASFNERARHPLPAREHFGELPLIAGLRRMGLSYFGAIKHLEQHGKLPSL